MYTWNERVTCFHYLSNASYIFSKLVWLYDANRLVVPTHTFPMRNHPYISMGNIDYLSIEVLMRHAI